MKKMKKLKNAVISGVAAVCAAGAVAHLPVIWDVYAAEIGYNRSTGDTIFTSGEVKALVIRLGYKDYPLDESNPHFRDDAYIMKLFEGEGGAPVSVQKKWEGGFSGWLNTSSYGKMSLTVGGIIDVEMSGNQADYFTESDDLVPFIGKIYENPEFKYAVQSQVNVADFDEDNDGQIDALYILNCAPNMGIPSSYYGFTNETGINHFVYTNFYSPEDTNYGSDAQAALEEIDFTVLTHESCHLLLALADYYVLEGFNDSKGPGNLMDHNMSDIDGYSKYLAGWLDDNNTVNVDIDATKNGIIYLTPSDSDSDSGIKLAFFNYYGNRSIVAEYVEGINNNSSGARPAPKKGFRFYLIDEKGEILKAHDSGDDYENMYQVFGDGEEINNLFDLGINISNIKAGENASFEFQINQSDLFYDESEILRIDLKGNKAQSGNTRILPLNSELEDYSAKKIIVVQTDDKSFIIYGEKDEFNDLGLSMVSHEANYTGEIGKIYKNIEYNGMPLFTDGSSYNPLDISGLYEGASYLWREDSYSDREELWLALDTNLYFNKIENINGSIAFTYSYPENIEQFETPEGQGDDIPEISEPPVAPEEPGEDIPELVDPPELHENSEGDAEADSPADSDREKDTDNGEADKEKISEKNSENTDNKDSVKSGYTSAADDSKVLKIKENTKKEADHTAKSEDIKEPVSTDRKASVSVQKQFTASATNTPRTGDKDKTLIFTSAAVASAAGIAGAVAVRRRKDLKKH